MLLAFMLSAVSAWGKIFMPAFFSDGMVLQQEAAVNLWGKADPNKKIKITVEWDDKEVVVKSDKQGNWKAVIQTPSYGGPYDIVVDDGTPYEVKNVLIGEVWICSGQSNMEMPMKGFKMQPVEGANIDAAYSKNNNIRLFTVGRNSQLEPQFDVKGEWKIAESESVREFSATAYYFGRMLNKVLDVPVGLIVTAWGGSACEAWMNKEWLKDEWLDGYRFPIPEKGQKIKSSNRTPSVLYNAMLHPLIGYTMKGVLWYQGEDNYDRAETYSDQLSTMVKGWREEWRQGDFPFYYCQIAPYDYSIITEKGKGVINSAYLREQQSKAEFIIPNCGMAVLMDAGLETCIHPRQKKIAGERLCLQALCKTYGVKGLVCDPPVYKSFEVKNDTVVVTFDRNKMWPAGKDVFESKNFKVAGEDRVFHPAKAWIVQKHVYVKSDKVKHPVAVRYAFENWADGDLFGEEIPVSSFRSDDWVDEKPIKK